VLENLAFLLFTIGAFMTRLYTRQSAARPITGWAMAAPCGCGGPADPTA
jgi:hypothetical protein